MGWLTFHETRTAKQYFIDEIGSGKNCELVDIAVVGFRTAYLAIKDLEKGYTYCQVYLLHRAPKSYYNFGYKPLSEFCGPCVDTCPKRILDKLTPLDEIKRLDDEIDDQSIEWAKNWRQNNLDAQSVKKTRSKALKNGVLKTKEPLRFTSGSEFQYFKKEGKRLYAIQDYGTEQERLIPVRISGWSNIEYEIV